MPKFSSSDVRAYMGLIRLMAGLDKQFSEDEGDYLDRIASEIGEERFWEHMQASYDADTSAEQIMALAGKIEDPEIHEVIYGNLYELSIAGGIEPAEEDLLDQLASLWNLQVEQQEPEFDD